MIILPMAPSNQIHSNLSNYFARCDVLLYTITSTNITKSLYGENRSSAQHTHANTAIPPIDSYLPRENNFGRVEMISVLFCSGLFVDSFIYSAIRLNHLAQHLAANFICTNIVSSIDDAIRSQNHNTILSITKTLNRWIQIIKWIWMASTHFG